MLLYHSVGEMMSKIEIGLCGPGRHEMPVSEFIYPFMVDNPLDFTANEAIAKEWLFELDEEVNEIHLYVTGLSPVLTSFMNAWLQQLVNYAPSLYLYHFNRDSGDYEVQQIIY